MENTNFLNDFLSEMEDNNTFESESNQKATATLNEEQKQNEPAEAVTKPTETIPQNLPKEDAPATAKPDTVSEPVKPTEKAQEAEVEQETIVEPQQQTLTGDPFEEALKKSEQKSKERLIGTLAEKNPIFKYASAKDDITDKDIEKSDKFIADLKKAKKDEDKNPDCIVKPFVKAQKKGDALAMPNYKGFYMSYDEAIQSNKVISFVPARDGRIYKIRKNQIGIFISQTAPER